MFVVLALVFGLCIGSFLNVVIHRLPRMMEREWLAQVPEVIEEAQALKGNAEGARVAADVRRLTRDIVERPLGLLLPGSRCATCGHAIAWYHNVPVLSYALLRGRCANCRAPFSLRYPIVELLAGLGAAYAVYSFGPTLKGAAVALFLWAVIALAFIDQERGYLPDNLTLPLMWLGLLVNLPGTFVPLREAIVGAAAGYLVLWAINAAFRAIRGVEGMGYGDFKMTAAVGAFLGWKALFMVVLLSSLVGLLFGTLQMFSARRGWDWKFRFHFGPYIAIAGLVAILWGAQLASRFPLLRPF